MVFANAPAANPDWRARVPWPKLRLPKRGADSNGAGYQAASAIRRGNIADTDTIPAPAEAAPWEGVGIGDVPTMYRRYRLIAGPLLGSLEETFCPAWNAVLR